eukprot:TRINITY_DN21798_c0_g1_i1.p1 TRINITY_DN21798_c0_g1~~TRINITY_DN21798_c0_g1_i1.p1  ORF type:complete len:217 (+),score=48.03 TRINITY_DN21798_c0_g1_i1:53-652(+)
MTDPKYGTFECVSLGLYEILGTSPTASEREIERSYRKTALKFHPDRNKDKRAVDVFNKIREAYETLTDAETKAAYDKKLAGKAAAEKRNMERSKEARDKREELNRREKASQLEKQTSISEIKKAKSQQQEEQDAIVRTRKRKRVESAAELEAALRSDLLGDQTVNQCLISRAFSLFAAEPPSTASPLDIEKLESQVLAF